MLAAIADTHAAIWYLFNDPCLGRAASYLIDTAIAAGDHIGISAIRLAEIVYLVEKRRIAATAFDDVLPAIADTRKVLHEVRVDSGL